MRLPRTVSTKLDGAGANLFLVYAFVFPDDPPHAPRRYDPRLRLALDLYNQSLAAGLQTQGPPQLDLSPRPITLPFGSLEMRVGETGCFPYGYTLSDVVPSSEWLVRGLRNRYRRAGIGAPVAAQAHDPEHTVSKWLPPRRKLPFTALLRFDNVRSGLREGALTGALDLYDGDLVETVKIGDYGVPVETDTTGVLGYRLEGSPIWDSEIAGFRRGDFRLWETANREANLYMLYPYRRGRIPVVFVHGTASSPARWAEMVNEILGDPRLASRYQLWFFQYNTGNPVAYSAMYLRDGLRQIVGDLDPKGTDPALCDMVVIGHSQGGLLTKMTVVSSGDKFWRLLSEKPFEEADLDEDSRDLARRTVFVEPIKCVRRVVFIATPHHGSYLADHFLGRIARRLVTLPATLTKTSLQLLRFHPRDALDEATSPPTSIDNMQGSNPFLKTLAALPVAQGVHAHSIVAVRGDGLPELGDDGVVKYASAHIEGVDSELIVHSGHSTQGEPATVEEVRRILLLHLTEP